MTYTKQGGKGKSWEPYCLYVMMKTMDFFSGMVDQRKVFFQQGPLPEILATTNL